MKKKKRALEVIHHHRLIELFLHRILGYRRDERLSLSVAAKVHVAFPESRGVREGRN